MKTTLWFDCETTGLDPGRHGIVQMAMLMDIDGYVEDRLVVKCQPFADQWMAYSRDSDYSANWAAIKAGHFSDGQTPTGIKFSEIITYQPPQEAFKQILDLFDKWIKRFDKTDKAYCGAYNARFDLDFLSAFFKKNGNGFLGSYINYKFIDPLPLLHARDWQGLISYKNYKLSTVCDIYGIPLIAHDPLSDIEATRELWYKLTGSTNVKSCCICGKKGDRRGPDRVNWFCQNHYETDVEERK